MARVIRWFSSGLRSAAQGIEQTFAAPVVSDGPISLAKGPVSPTREVSAGSRRGAPRPTILEESQTPAPGTGDENVGPPARRAPRSYDEDISTLESADFNSGEAAVQHVLLLHRRRGAKVVVRTSSYERGSAASAAEPTPSAGMPIGRT
jgi:hypothetical protein